MKKKVLAAIFLLALLLRFWNLGTYPEAIDEDEMAFGYYGYSLIKNGTDEYGNKFPIYFESAGDFKYGLYSYFAAIPVGIFGLNPTTTRSIAAVAGSLSVIVIYYLAKEVFDKERYALITSFVLAVSPMHIHFSRVAYNNVLGAFFAILSILFLIRWFKKGRPKELLLLSLFFVLSIFTYQTYRVFLPVSFVLLFAIYFKKLAKKRRKNAALLVLGAIAIVYLSFVPAKSRTRAQDFSLLTNEPKLLEQFTEDSIAETPLLVTRAFHNKLTASGLGFAERYLSYFDPTFLFARTSPTTERHTIPDIGLLYLFEGVFFVLGVLYLFKLVDKNDRWVPLAILAASPVAASMVVEPRSAIRTIVIVYAYALLVGLGIYVATNIKKFSSLALFVVGAFYLANFSFFAHQYFVHKTYHNPWYSDVGLKEMVQFVNQNKDDYSAVVMSRGHYIPYLFYNRVAPREFIENSEFASEVKASGVRVERYGKINFNMPYECPPAGKEGVLYVCFGYRVPKTAKLQELIRYRDGQPALFFVTFGEEALEELPDRMEYSADADDRFEDGVIPDDYEEYWPVN